MLFFFSSRRRHTRWPRDWSSDVCSSDLGTSKKPSWSSGMVLWVYLKYPLMIKAAARLPRHWRKTKEISLASSLGRSEERRVGKECKAQEATEKERKRQHRHCRRSRQQ